MASSIPRLSRPRFAPAPPVSRVKPSVSAQCSVSCSHGRRCLTKSRATQLSDVMNADPTACKILDAAGIDYAKRTYQLSEGEMRQIRDELENFTVEGDLRRMVNMNIKRLKEIQCYRGRRHYMSLPTRGQKSKTNAKTAKRMLR